ncbi:MAG: hypothetical protein ACLPN1_18225 [Dissulfurispiraceae bacterium]
MSSQVISSGTLNEPIAEKASSYRHIMRALIDKLEGGMICLKNVPIMQNGGRHCILVRDLSRNKALGTHIDSVADKFNRLKDIEITISREDISTKERFDFSYIVVVQHGQVKAELP